MNSPLTRRAALQTMAWGAVLLGSPSLFAQAPAPAGPHKLPDLGYAFDALEPAIDAKTMEIHHGRHHKAYVDNLNRALAAHPDLQKLSLEELLGGLDKVPESIRTAVRNNGGGHYNHSLFWQVLKPTTTAPATTSARRCSRPWTRTTPTRRPRTSPRRRWACSAPAGCGSA
jgi:hypothetical protein